jgi:integrase
LESLLAKGWPERDAVAEVQEKLRHKNPGTTEIYLYLIHPAGKDVRSPLMNSKTQITFLQEDQESRFFLT